MVYVHWYCCVIYGGGRYDYGSGDKDFIPHWLWDLMRHPPLSGASSTSEGVALNSLTHLPGLHED